MKKIEAAPLDLTEDQATILWDWSYEIETVIKRSAGIAIAMNVGRNTLLHGESSVSHKEYGRRCGVCRRTIDTAVKQLKQHDIIQRIGTTEAGVAIYRANFQWRKAPANGVA
ncbi:hypothetical protein DKP76_01535 [Falsochrobactrum shanghaiense]|uniref:Helix-turn-helix domain-containing protein n=1 Tax=Falsochrobactrum shanghaiense TaxID=2201899 RepID=A0A316JVP7_9HYPH|nr:hypothetical protein [Falsochrobactrum shanghaiense]PWL19270.1 hypothetical protein DKP76_01535 [Falsochrobactrum shanghaiense]